MMDINNLKVNLENKILNSEKTIILPHKNADFDAIGSALGLSVISKSLNKDSKIIIDDKKYELDRAIKYIIDDTKNDYEIISACKYKKIFNSNDLYILTDVNKNYMIPISDLIHNDDNTIIIDHHEEDRNTVKSSNKFIDTDASSASEIVARALFEMNIQIPCNIANYLLVGIYLDTNKLTKNVSKDTLLIAGKLMENGADTNKVMELFAADFESDKRAQDLVNKTKMLSYKIALIIADAKDEYTTKEIAKTADLGLSYGTDASFAIGRISSDIVGISARSRDKIDVAKIMSEFGGGGNPYSAAARVEGEVPEVANKLEKILRPKYYFEKKES
jgi:c-di-AMP phosphodiesterase-like protein